MHLDEIATLPRHKSGNVRKQSDAIGAREAQDGGHERGVKGWDCEARLTRWARGLFDRSAAPPSFANLKSFLLWLNLLRPCSPSAPPLPPFLSPMSTPAGT